MMPSLALSRIALWRIALCRIALWRIMVLLVLACGAATAQTPEPVITDTADYCAQLQLQVDDAFAHAASQPSPTIRALADNGQAMCRHGEIRGGIVHLRKALMALKKAP